MNPQESQTKSSNSHKMILNQKRKLMLQPQKSASTEKNSQMKKKRNSHKKKTRKFHKKNRLTLMRKIVCRILLPRKLALSKRPRIG